MYEALGDSPHPHCVVDIEGTEIGGEEDFGNNLQNGVSSLVILCVYKQL